MVSYWQLRPWSTFKHSHMTTAWCSTSPTDVMQPAVPRIGALPDGKATVGSCLHSVPDTADEVTTALVTLFITLSGWRQKTQLLLHHHLGDNNTDDVTKNTHYFVLCSKYSLGLYDRVCYILVAGLIFQECLLLCHAWFFIGCWTDWVRSESAENGANLKPTWYNEMLDGDIVICLFP